MPEVAIKYQPHAHQQKFHQATARVKSLVAGARSGKSLAGAAEMVLRAILQPGYSRADIDSGVLYTIACAAPTYPMLKDVVIPAFQRLMPPELVVSWSKSELTMVVRAAGTGRFTRVLFKNADRSETWQGLDLYAAWLDECAMMNAAIFDEARTRVANQQGVVLLTSTPIGRNWLWKDVYNRSLDTPNEVFCHKYFTSENPYFPKDELERKRRELPPPYFKRTFEASFDEFQGQIYTGWNPLKHLADPSDLPGHIRGFRSLPVTPWQRVVAGVDWGFVHKGVISVWGVTKDGDYWGLDESADSGVMLDAPRDPSADSWVARARALRDKYGVSIFYCDPAEPGAIECFIRNGINAMPADNSVFDGIQSVAKLMHIDPVRGLPRMRILRGKMPQFCEEVTSYHWKPNKDGDATEEPVRENDDACCAVRYCLATDVQQVSGGRWVGGARIPY